MIDDFWVVGVVYHKKWNLFILGEERKIKIAIIIIWKSNKDKCVCGDRIWVLRDKREQKPWKDGKIPKRLLIIYLWFLIKDAHIRKFHPIFFIQKIIQRTHLISNLLSVQQPRFVLDFCLLSYILKILNISYSFSSEMLTPEIWIYLIGFPSF